MFQEDNVYRATFALTTEIEIIDRCQLAGPGEHILAIGLGNSVKLQLQFGSPTGQRGNGVRIFPIAFSSIACGAQSKGAPKVYDRLAEPIRQRLKGENDDVNIFKVESFQLYNSTKQQIRQDPVAFHAGRSILTGATCRMASQGSVKDRNRQKKMQDLVAAGEPFRQIIEGSEQAVSEGRIRTRLEPVISIDVHLIESRRNIWKYVVKKVILPLYKLVRDHAEEICYEMLDIYNPLVCNSHFLYCLYLIYGY
jgi:hypothetical protein